MLTRRKFNQKPLTKSIICKYFFDINVTVRDYEPLFVTLTQFRSCNATSPHFVFSKMASK